MNEAEAKTRWCPRSAGPPSKFEHCIGSACMAWRTRPNDEFNKGAIRALHRGVELRPMPADLEGWCGLAGEPPIW